MAYLWPIVSSLHHQKQLDGLNKNPLLVLALASESELVLGLSVRDLVDAEPLVSGPQKTREVALDILNVVELGSQGVVDVNDNDLPVGLLLVQKSHHAEDLDLLDLAGVANQLADLADVQRVVVALGLGLGVDNVGVLPGLLYHTSACIFSGSRWATTTTTKSYLREGTIVPEVPLVGEAVANKSELALLDVLLDGVEQLVLGDLLLGVGPAGDLNNHVEDGLLGVGIEGDVVEGGDGDAILLDVHAVLEGVGGADLADGVGHFVERLTAGGRGEVSGNLGCPRKRLLREGGRGI